MARKKRDAIPAKPLRNGLYVWLYVTLAYLPNAVNVGDTTQKNVTLNVANVKKLLQNASVTIDPVSLKSMVTNLLDSTNNQNLAATRGLLLSSPPFNGWSGGDVHPRTDELDSIFITP
jgi:hypothetical protein